jgi:hypothetical protein
VEIMALSRNPAPGFQTCASIPDYYGQNFDALNECLGDLPVPEDGGAAIVLQTFDAYAKSLPAITCRQSSQTDAEVLLDILASASRMHLLYGKRFLTLKATIPGSDLNDWGASVRPGTPRSGSTKTEVFDYRTAKRATLIPKDIHDSPLFCLT